MPDVTVAGSQGTSISIPISTTQNAQVAQSLLDLVSSQVIGGDVTSFTYSGIGPLQAPSGPSLLIVEGLAAASLPGTVSTVVDIAGQPVILFGGTAASQLVVSQSDLAYFANTGTGTVIASGGGNIITELAGGDHLFLTDGNGNLISALSGNDTIGAGPGSAGILLGAGNDLVQVSGSDSIVAGTGNDTVEVLAGTAIVQGGYGSLLLINGAGNSTVLAGEGSATLSGGDGGGLYYGGHAGNNALTTGLQSTTLFGGGEGDQFFAVGGGHDLLVGGYGQESMTGTGTGSDTFIGGNGRQQITGGFGPNVFVAGQGSETLTGGASTNTYLFDATQSSGNVVITDFRPGSDTLQLQGFGPDEVQAVLQGQMNVGGSTEITLSDNTTVTFQNIARLDKSSFS